MGDVVTALARAVQDEGHEVEVVLPKYDIINYAEVGSQAFSLLPFCPTLSAYRWVPDLASILVACTSRQGGVLSTLLMSRRLLAM